MEARTKIYELEILFAWEERFVLVLFVCEWFLGRLYSSEYDDAYSPLVFPFGCLQPIAFYFQEGTQHTSGK